MSNIAENLGFCLVGVLLQRPKILSRLRLHFTHSFYFQKANIQYVDIPAYNEDDDDDAFLPPGTPTARPPPYANVTSTPGSNGHTESVGSKPHTLSHSNSHTSYVNIEGAHSQSNGLYNRPSHNICACILSNYCIRAC